MKTIINIFKRDPEKSPRYFFQAIQDKGGVLREILRGTADDRGITEIDLAFRPGGATINYSKEPAPE